MLRLRRLSKAGSAARRSTIGKNKVDHHRLLARCSSATSGRLLGRLPRCRLLRLLRLKLLRLLHHLSWLPWLLLHTWLLHHHILHRLLRLLHHATSKWLLHHVLHRLLLLLHLNGLLLLVHDLLLRLLLLHRLLHHAHCGSSSGRSGRSNSGNTGRSSLLGLLGLLRRHSHTTRGSVPYHCTDLHELWWGCGGLRQV